MDTIIVSKFKVATRNCETALYYDWLSLACAANQNTRMPGASQRRSNGRDFRHWYKNDLLHYSFTYGMNEYIIQALIVNWSNLNVSKIMNPVRSPLRKIGLN